MPLAVLVCTLLACELAGKLTFNMLASYEAVLANSSMENSSSLLEKLLVFN